MWHPHKWQNKHYYHERECGNRKTNHQLESHIDEHFDLSKITNDEWLWGKLLDWEGQSCNRVAFCSCHGPSWQGHLHVIYSRQYSRHIIVGSTATNFWQIPMTNAQDDDTFPHTVCVCWKKSSKPVMRSQKNLEMTPVPNMAFSKWLYCNCWEHMYIYIYIILVFTVIQIHAYEIMKSPCDLFIGWVATC